MFRFANPEYLYLLLVIPALFGLYLFSSFIRRQKLSEFGNMELIRQLMPGVSPRRGWIKFIIYMLAYTAIVFGIARPQFGSKLTEAKRKGIELMIALDVSNSMMAQDIQPNRLERAKQAISRLVDQLTNDRIGLIVFAGDAYVQLPVTNDYTSAKMFLSSISPGIVPKQGTAIGAAIDLAASSFSPSDNTSKVIIVISDGENHEDDPLQSAQRAADRGIVVHTIGIGSPQGAPIPASPNSRDFLRDKDGNVVVTRLDEETLSKIALSAGGKYIRASNSQIGLLPLFDEINRMERTELKEKVFSEYDDQFQYLFGLALILLAIDFFILERRNRVIQRLNLFGDRDDLN
ncbi:vWA domain-containing protein [Perlabentimonas gracilis]|uniref:vWA domain-containing protein n=1 Tax=Perlabentimonas gracilis TaxID=2715279 RepID=UPI00140E5728|nr:VWA domain-containing protein [Perlabentimonas gracilis]NHB68515.1 VWA domain-containing protein [Perlabentimonas gracilis]